VENVTARNNGGPTRRQREVLRAIRDHLRANGYPPTVRELSRMLGLRSTATTQQHLVALARKGYLEHDPVKARALRVVWQDPDAPGVVGEAGS